MPGLCGLGDDGTADMFAGGGHSSLSFLREVEQLSCHHQLSYTDFLIVFLCETRAIVVHTPRVGRENSTRCKAPGVVAGT